MTTALIQEWRERAEQAGWTEGEEEAFQKIESDQKRITDDAKFASAFSSPVKHPGFRLCGH